MAENKKSFIAYSSWNEMIKHLPDEIAGKLFKHIFAYVNDENPVSEDWQINALFGQIKAQLKEDLKKWENQREQRSEAGKKSAENRATKSNDRSNSFNEKERNPTVNVNDNVNDNVIVNVNANVTANENEKNKYRKLFLSKIVEADLDEDMKTYFKIAVSFQELFKKIVIESGGTTSQLEKATGKWIDDIRLMVESDKIEIEKIRQVWGWLPKSDFWKKNIQSTATLRKQFNKLIIESNHERTKANNGGISESNQEILRRGAERIFAQIDERDRKLSGEQI